MVWLDIDRTSGSLDSILELLDAEGNILTQSNSSLHESIGWTSRFVSGDASAILPAQVQGLDADPFAPRNPFFSYVANDFHSVNPHDSGMRIILPGVPGESSTFYVRVRSSNVPSGSSASSTPALQDSNALRGGITSGGYRLQVRLRQQDEVPGSTVQYADIRYATNGIEALGMPASSPLLGQQAEDDVRHLGNIANSDRASVTISGFLAEPDQVDHFTFTVQRDSVQVIDPEDGSDHISVVFDIDYADGFGRPGTRLWVFNSAASWSISAPTPTSPTTNPPRPVATTWPT